MVMSIAFIVIAFSPSVIARPHPSFAGKKKEKDKKTAD
jgi:hypothetical protein